MVPRIGPPALPARRRRLLTLGCLGAALSAFATPGAARAFAILDAVSGDPVYTGQAIVTGTDNRDRPRGLTLCLAEVLVKASGDPAIPHNAGFAAIAAEAPGMVRAIAYHDRMSGMPKHDEQGTRDRPFTLTAAFDPAKIEAALHRLGSAVWQGRRAPVFLVVDVHGFSGRFTLTAGPAAGYDQKPLMRAALAEAAARVALPVILPATETAAPPAGALRVSGSLVWSDAADGWIAQWQAEHEGRRSRWAERGVSFDQAFDAALQGALAIQSSHRPPAR